MRKEGEEERRRGALAQFIEDLVIVEGRIILALCHRSSFGGTVPLSRSNSSTKAPGRCIVNLWV